MRAKLSEAEAVRRLRLAARSEVQLRQRVIQRDSRVTQLRQQLEVRGLSL